MSGVLRKMNLEVDLEGEGLDELSEWIKKLNEARMGGHGMEGVLNDMQRDMKRFGVNVRDTIDQTAGFSKMMQGLAGAGAAWKIIDIGKDVLKQAADYETASVSFEVMLGGAEKAKEVMTTLNQFSIKTPFEPKEVMESGRALMAFGVQQKDLENTLQMVGDVASGVGMNFSELSQIYGKNMTSGLVQTEDLNQLAGRGIPIYAELAKVFGKNSEEIRGMASSGQIKFEHLQKVFQNMTGEGGKYFGMMEKQSRTWAGLMSTLTGNINEVKRVLGGVLADALRPLVLTLGQFLGWILQNETALKVMKVLFITLIPVIGVLLVSALWSAGTAAFFFAKGMILATWPAFLIAAGIMALILIIEDLYQWFTGGESVIGKWLDPLMININKVKIFFINAWNSIRDFFSRNGKYIVMAMFPFSVLYYYWDEIMAFIQSIPDKIVSFFTSLPDRLMSALSSLGESLKDLLVDILPDWAIKLIANLSGEGIEARAGGGPVFGGRPYLVGERGPELFVPGSSGAIISNYTMGASGGKSVNVTIAPVINFNGSASRDDADTIVSRIMSEIEDAIEQAGFMAGLETG